MPILRNPLTYLTFLVLAARICSPCQTLLAVDQSCLLFTKAGHWCVNATHNRRHVSDKQYAANKNRCLVATCSNLRPGSRNMFAVWNFKIICARKAAEKPASHLANSSGHAGVVGCDWEAKRGKFATVQTLFPLSKATGPITMRGMSEMRARFLLFHLRSVLASSCWRVTQIQQAASFTAVYAKTSDFSWPRQVSQ
jgi:hypothetical protein